MATCTETDQCSLAPQEEMRSYPQNRAWDSPQLWPTGLASLQEGFGWTNGVALMLMDRYGDRLTSGTQLALLMPHCLAATFLFHLLLGFLSQ